MMTKNLISCTQIKVHISCERLYSDWYPFEAIAFATSDHITLSSAIGSTFGDYVYSSITPLVSQKRGDFVVPYFQKS